MSSEFDNPAEGNGSGGGSEDRVLSSSGINDNVDEDEDGSGGGSEDRVVSSSGSSNNVEEEGDGGRSEDGAVSSPGVKRNGVRKKNAPNISRKKSTMPIRPHLPKPELCFTLEEGAALGLCL